MLSPVAPSSACPPRPSPAAPASLSACRPASPALALRSHSPSSFTTPPPLPSRDRIPTDEDDEDDNDEDDDDDDLDDLDDLDDDPHAHAPLSSATSSEPDTDDTDDTSPASRLHRLYHPLPTTPGRPQNPTSTPMEMEGNNNMLSAAAVTPSNASTTLTTNHTPALMGMMNASSLATQLQSPRSRNRSPYARSHVRSYSTSSSLSAAPLMTRAHSLPTFMNPSVQLSPSPSPIIRPSSPLRSPARVRSPQDQGLPSVCDISEDMELDLTPRAGSGHNSPAGLQSPLSPMSAFNRRRRPVSPLHQTSMNFTIPTSSPLLAPSKFVNEPFPSGYPASSYSSSSVPSTPTSTRSRSPSISSLETIPDIPDAEVEAMEADRLARLKAAESAEKHGSLDVPGGIVGGRNLSARDKRKRWSVCGGERHQDLNLETIWED